MCFQVQNSLYYVRAYNHRKNHRARFVVTAVNEGMAASLVSDHLGTWYNIESTTFVCSVESTTEVFMEAS